MTEKNNQYPKPGQNLPNPMDIALAKGYTQQQLIMMQNEYYVSQQTKDKAEAFRLYIERKYSKRKQEEEEKKANWEQIQQKMENLNYSATEQERIKKELFQKEAEFFRKKRKKISPRDFNPLAIIGRGAFGEVRICRWKETNEIVAMKKMNKSEMVHKNQVQHVRAERDVLAAAKNPWIVELKCSFQDEKYLYLVMEYLPGGDLMNLLIKKEILTEEEAKFYIAEAILAVESVHKLNYIHRDLKPDNILLDAKGHIKLSDFGLCKHADIKPRKFEVRKNEEIPEDLILTKSSLVKKQHGYRRNRQLAFSTVGTPDYIAPEVFSQNGYTETVDWWSLGVILFEMLVGYPTFSSEDAPMTCQKIIHWKKTFHIPSDANLSPAAIDLIRRLIADPNERLGVNGVEEIKAHPFFVGIDWKRIREKKAPNVPELASDIDTKYFDNYQELEPWISIDDPNKPKKNRKDVNFIGYTFKRDLEAQRSLLVSALQELEANKLSNPRPKTDQQKPFVLKSLENYNILPIGQEFNSDNLPIDNNNDNDSHDIIRRNTSEIKKFSTHRNAITSEYNSLLSSETTNTIKLDPYTTTTTTTNNNNNLGLVLSKPPSQVNIALTNSNLTSNFAQYAEVINARLNIVAEDNPANNNHNNHHNNNGGSGGIGGGGGGHTYPDHVMNFGYSKLNQLKPEFGLSNENHEQKKVPNLGIGGYNFANIITPDLTRLRNQAQLGNRKINNMNVISSITNPNTNANPRSGINNNNNNNPNQQILQ